MWDAERYRLSASEGRDDHEWVMDGPSGRSIKAGPLDGSQGLADARNRRYWILGNWKQNFALYSAKERRDPLAHSICCTYTKTERQSIKQPIKNKGVLQLSSRPWTKFKNELSTFDLHNLWQLKLTSELLSCNPADQCAHLRGLVALGLLLYELSFGVNRKDSANWHSNLLIGKDVLEETFTKSDFRTTSAVLSAKSTNKNNLLR